MFYKNVKFLIFTTFLIILLNINIARVVAVNFLIDIQSPASEIEVNGKYKDKLNDSIWSDTFNFYSLGDFSMKLNIKIKNTQILCGTFKLSSNTNRQDNKATLSYSYSSALSSPPEECSHAEILFNVDDLADAKNVTSQNISLLSNQEQSITIDEITSSNIQCAIQILDKHENNSLNEDNAPDEENSLNEDNAPDEENSLNEDNAPDEENSLHEDNAPDEENSLHEDNLPDEDEYEDERPIVSCTIL